MNSEDTLQLQDLEAWKRAEGYWYGKLSFFNQDGRYNYIATNTPTGGQFDYRNYYGFFNLQVEDGEMRRRELFIRPPLDIEPFDLNNDSTISSDELHLFGFTSPFGYDIDTDTKRATPHDEEINPYQYNEGTERSFAANQRVNDDSGLLQGSTSGIPTTTQALGDDTLVFRAGTDPTVLLQNQLTTMPDRDQRVSTAQGISGGQPIFANFYRETKINATVDDKGYVVRTARKQFLDLLNEHRRQANIPESLITDNTTEFFTTGLEQPDPRGIAIQSQELSLDGAIGRNAEAGTTLKGNRKDNILILSGNNLKANGRGGANTFVISSFSNGRSADIIRDFNPGDGDRLALDPSVIQAPEHDPLTFAVAADKTEYRSLRKDAPVVIYREDNGHLIFDANGFAAGLGEGGRLLQLKGAPELVVGDLFSLIDPAV